MCELLVIFKTRTAIVKGDFIHNVLTIKQSRRFHLKYSVNLNYIKCVFTFYRLPKSDLTGPEVNSYHDEDASMNNIGNLNPSISLSPKTSTISTETESQFIKEWIQFPPREHASETDPGETSSQLQGHVNIWLFICFGAAGLALVASLLFFAFHCFQRHRQRQEHSTDQYQAMDHRFGEYEICATGNIRPMQVNETVNINTCDHPSASYSTNFQV